MTAARAERLRIRRGLDLPVAGAPVQTVGDSPAVGSVALLGSDYPGIRPELLVAENDRVRAGEPLFRDRRRPAVQFASPGTGRVTAIHRGPRRAIQSIVVELEDPDTLAYPAEAPAQRSREAIAGRLLSSGLWPAFRTRPFSRIPDPGSVPDAIFVTAIDTNPLAADPAVVLAGQESDFDHGIAALDWLTDGPVYVCHAPELELTLTDRPSVVDVSVAGPHPAGLPGTHIHLLHPVGDKRSVWHVNYQDVVAIGRLFDRGEISLQRVIAIGGPAARQPRLVRTRLGAGTDDLLADDFGDQQCRVVSGSILSGHRAAGWARYLGRYHLQLSLLPEGGEREFLGWLAPGFDKFSAVNAFASSLLPGRRFRLSTSQHGSPRAMVPIGNFEKVMPLDILPAPLLKALLVEDVDSARALGCLELDEEDLALCSFVCCSKYDYGAALRKTLDLIERDA